MNEYQRTETYGRCLNEAIKHNIFIHNMCEIEIDGRLDNVLNELEWCRSIWSSNKKHISKTQSHVTDYTTSTTEC
jgi:hypothetical protein